MVYPVWEMHSKDRLPMLKLQSITNDPLNRIAMVRFTEVFDEHPQISVAMRLPTLDTQNSSRGARRDQGVCQNATQRSDKSLFLIHADLRRARMMGYAAGELT